MTKRFFFISWFALLVALLPSPVLAKNQQIINDSFARDDAFFETYDTMTSVADPLEGLNRAIYHFNDAVIEYVAKPVNAGYCYVTPGFLRRGIQNVFHNALFPVRFVNNLLQGKGRAAGVEMSLFFLNTTAGIGGLIDVGSSHKTVVPVDDEDLGQTFGVWGIGEGCYLVLPLFGPSTLRDTAGMGGDFFLDPLTYIRPASLSLSLAGGRVVSSLDSTLDNYDDIKRSAVEPYMSFKDAYVQHRRAKVAK